MVKWWPFMRGGQTSPNYRLNSRRAGRRGLCLMPSDLPWRDGDLRKVPQITRKQLLGDILVKPRAQIRPASHQGTHGSFSNERILLLKLYLYCTDSPDHVGLAFRQPSLRRDCPITFAAWNHGQGHSMKRMIAVLLQLLMKNPNQISARDSGPCHNVLSQCT